MTEPPTDADWRIVGEFEQFGFRMKATWDPPMREVSIFIGGRDLTRWDNTVYLPSFIGQLEQESERIKRKIDYLRHEQFLHNRNLSQIHHLLLHGDPSVFRDESEWGAAEETHAFGDWGPTTGEFVAFLVPYCDRLFLTYQLRDERSRGFERVDVIDGVETTPHFLVSTLDDAVSVLREGESRAEIRRD